MLRADDGFTTPSETALKPCGFALKRNRAETTMKPAETARNQSPKPAPETAETAPYRGGRMVAPLSSAHPATLHGSASPGGSPAMQHLVAVRCPIACAWRIVLS
jgi:hypothetical protein